MKEIDFPTVIFYEARSTEHQCLIRRLRVIHILNLDKKMVVVAGTTKIVNLIAMGNRLET